MKIKLFTLCLGCLLITFLACDDKNLDIPPASYNYDVIHVETIPVSLDGTNSDWMTFNYKNTLTINNEETKFYSSKIKNVQINKLSYRIVNFNGDPLGEVNGSFSVANKVCLENSFVVKPTADNQVIYEITSNEEINRIAEALKSNQTVNVVYSGSALCNDSGMDFFIEITLDTKVTIQL